MDGHSDLDHVVVCEMRLLHKVTAGILILQACYCSPGSRVVGGSISYTLGIL